MKNIYVVQSEGVVVGAFGSIKKAYDFSINLLYNPDEYNLKSYNEICKDLNPKNYYRSQSSLGKNFSCGVDIYLTPLNEIHN